MKPRKCLARNTEGVSLYIYGNEVETLIVFCVFERTVVIKG